MVLIISQCEINSQWLYAPLLKKEYYQNLQKFSSQEKMNNLQISQMKFLKNY